MSPSVSPINCAQCGLPTGRDGTHSESEPIFCCYGCSLVYQIAGDKSDQSRSSWLLSRLGLSLFLAMNVMMLTMIVYTPSFFPRDTGSSGELQEQFLSLTRYALLLFATPVVGLLGVPILRNAVRAGLRRHFGIDALIALGCFAAYGLSVHATFTNRNDVYYETATMVLVLVSFGRYLEARAKVSSANSIEALLIRDVPEITARVGDMVPVLPGSTFPVDGIVVSGQGHVNEAALSGESRPVEKQSGDRVFAGTTSIDGSFQVRVTAIGSERRLAKLAQLLEEVRQAKSPLQRFAEKVAQVFVPVTAAVAVLTLVGWTVHDSFHRGLLNSLAVLLIACPCALGIATPLAIWKGIERAARRGIFLRNGEILETLANVDRVFFDKTGTLTTGSPTLQRIEVASDAGADEASLLRRVGSLESHSEHPIARAVCAELSKRELKPLEVSNVKIVPGRGIAGRVENERHQTLVGSATFLRQGGCASNGRNAAADSTVIFCGWDGRVRGTFLFSDSLRPDAKETIEALRTCGIQTNVLTGDDSSAGSSLAEQLGVEVQANLTPEDKVEIVARAAQQQTVAMVGDGINDAPALGRACVGIVLRGGTDVAREAADVNFADNELRKLPWLFGLARAVRRTIRVNLFWAFAYNVVLLPLAAAGFLRPILAALAMLLSSAFVVANSMRLRNRGA